MKLWWQWITPFQKQCFVVAGVTLNLLQFGLVYGFTSSLLPQLRQLHSSLRIDDSAGSWIASIPAIASILTVIVIPSFMGRYGRKISLLVSIIPMSVGWFFIAFTTNFTITILARFLQGIALGVGQAISSILIAEYSSPVNRGAFLITLSLSFAVGTHASHTMGLYLRWQTAAVISGAVSVVTLLIVACSPESPSWLIHKGKYEEGMKAFRWLRGDGEEDELMKMIEANISLKNTRAGELQRNNFKLKLNYLIKEIKNPSFHKPAFIMTHLLLLTHFSGAAIISSYAVDISKVIIGNDIDISLIIVSADTLRLILNVCAIFLIRNFRRKTMLFATVALNVFAFFATALYTFVTSRNMLPSCPILGIFLFHLHIAAIGLGTLPVPIAIIGEIIPLRYRNYTCIINGCVNAFGLFVTTKTVPFLMDKVGLHGMYCINCGLFCYSFVLSIVFLRETKNRTLQDIEEDFRGKQHLEGNVMK